MSFSELLDSFYMLLNWDTFLFINVGLLVGIIFGSLPGLTTIMGVTLALPFTFNMPPTTGIGMLLGVYCGGVYGGSITAILIRTPGTPASAATLNDGFELTKKGHALKAMQMALFASVISGIISALMLLFIAPQLAKVALKFGSAEYFALAVFGLSVVIAVNSSILKGIAAACIGMMIKVIGLDPIDGLDRFTFDSLDLSGGIELVPALIGLFAMSEILRRIDDLRQTGKLSVPSSTGSGLTVAEFLPSLKTIIKSSFIGTFIGAVPGTGAVTSSFLSYTEAKRSSKNPDEFGKGSLEGIAASEAGNNGITGATLIPMLTLGIPGDIIAAILLGALMVHGLIPGPKLFENHATEVYGLIFSLFIINILMIFHALTYIKMYKNVMKINPYLFTSILFIFCVSGCYAVNNSLFDIQVMMVFGIIGFILPKFDYPLTPLLMGIVLGPIAESSFRQALTISKGSYSIFINQPISAVILAVSIGILALSTIRKFTIKRKQPIKNHGGKSTPTT